MLAAVLAAPVVWAETHEDEPGADLLPVEAAAVANAVPVRRAEFTTVRVCARRALARLGLPPVPLPPGGNRAPVWPEGIVGSMTHCAGYRAAAVARADRILALGIDAEPHEPLPDGVLDLVASPAEQEHLTAASRDHPDRHWDRILFSAKESVYKAWYPHAQRWLGFEDVDLVLSPHGTFTARFLVPAPLPGLTGRWSVSDGLVVTAITLPTPRD